MNERIEIYPSRIKLLFTLVSFFIYFLAAIYTCVIAENIVKIIVFTSIPFCGFFIYEIIKRLLEYKLMLIIDEKGLSLSPDKDEFIKWGNIDGFTEIKEDDTKIIIVQVNNAEEFIEKETNNVRKKIMKNSLKNYGSPFHISVSEMNVKHNTLIKLLNENLVKYKPDGK